MAKKRLTPQQEQAFHAGIAYERNQIIDMIQEQISSCPYEVDECDGCKQDVRLINTLLQKWDSKDEDNS